MLVSYSWWMLRTCSGNESKCCDNGYDGCFQDRFLRRCLRWLQADFQMYFEELLYSASAHCTALCRENTFICTLLHRVCAHRRGIIQFKRGSTFCQSQNSHNWGQPPGLENLDDDAGPPKPSCHRCNCWSYQFDPTNVLECFTHDCPRERCKNKQKRSIQHLGLIVPNC